MPRLYVQDVLGQRYGIEKPWLLDPDDPLLADYFGRLGAMLAIQERVEERKAAAKALDLKHPRG